MEDTLLKVIPVTDMVQVCLFESRTRDGGAYISVKHAVKIREMPGEVIIDLSAVPNLIKALAEAAVELEARTMYFAGVEDGRT